MNLPGSADYDPRLPWVSKVRMCDSLIACDVFIYVDDLRITGMTEEEAWRAAHVVGCVLAWLGIQDASRKRRDASRTAGAWAGSVVYSTPEEVFVLVTQEKWEKGKLMIHELQDCLREWPSLNRKRLQQVRGYLNYIALTYPILLTRLMVFHLTIDGWRKNRDQRGWRCKNATNQFEDEYTHNFNVPGHNDGPKEVEAKPRLYKDLDALSMLMEQSCPPLRTVRSSKIVEVYYGFGDASGSAFGGTFQGRGPTYFEYEQ